MQAPPSLEELNRCSAADFATALAPFFEGAPPFISRLAERRPFASLPALFEAARALAREMPRDEQVELLAAHPRIGADPAAVSPLSHAEQGYDRSPPATDAETAGRLDELNHAYEARFGFRFVIFVAGRPRAAIVPILRAALAADPEAELRRGLDDVVSIAQDRLRTLSAAEEPRPTIGA